MTHASPDLDTDLPESFADSQPKLLGADVELGNFVIGGEPRTKKNGFFGYGKQDDGTGAEASRRLLREVVGLPKGGRQVKVKGCDCTTCRAERQRARERDKDGDDSYSTGSGYDPQDIGRRFLSSNGGCVYIDLDHLEVCLPEVRSAYDFVAAWHAMLEIARTAQTAANAKLPQGQRIHIHVNNSDGQGNSYGSHLNFLMSRRAWDNIFNRKILHMLYLASYQVSSILFTGQGKVGAENGMPACDYQLAQRADFFETLCGMQTTYRRPIVNSRDESLCGPEGYGNPLHGRARLHVIFYDSTLCHTASFLKVGVMQLLLAMIEAEQINPSLILDDPVDAVVRWSHDPTLRAKARLASGRKWRAIDLQLAFFEEVQRFVESGGCDGLVPHAGEILTLWGDTLAKLQAGNLDALAGRIDWILKLRLLEHAQRQHPDVRWGSPQMKHLDLLYSSLDPADGLYWACERKGRVERIVSPERIARFVTEPPEDTRAWTRAMLLRTARPEDIDDVDWDSIRFEGRRSERTWSSTRTLELANPLGNTKAECGPLFDKSRKLDHLLDDIEELNSTVRRAGSASDSPILLPAAAMTNGR